MMLNKKLAIRPWSLALAGLLLLLLVACGGPDPTPQIVVVPRSDTATPVTLVVTATFTPTPEEAATEPPPTETPTLEPTVTLAPTASGETTMGGTPVEFETYEHPSGVFQHDIPVGVDQMEDEDGVYFEYGDSLIMSFFTVPDQALGLDELEAAVPLILEDALVGEGLILSYDDLEIERLEGENVVVIGGYTIDTDR
ncbi:MAG: hypothetical protein PVJ34_22490, partial [Anaerolineae bacterium]